MKEIADYWFHSPGGECGIMVVEVEITGERKAYVGVGTGLNYAADRKRILMWGTKLPQSRLEEILRLLQGKATKIEVMKGLLESQVIKDDLGALDPRKTGSYWRCAPRRSGFPSMRPVRNSGACTTSKSEQDE
ncbi:hypothetical protein LCGC14_1175430 [marine sediment metagenome]|uniref:Uncharacterized protein n=1 Tax=marine sediment metagenome TaxID=412755 RepID=A0A0F9LTI1_9ZZZZ